MDEIRAALGGALPEQGEDPRRVIEHLARAADPGLDRHGRPRYFGFVIGGILPVALAADWLASAWDQNAALYVTSPRSRSSKRWRSAGCWSSSTSRAPSLGLRHRLLAGELHRPGRRASRRPAAAGWDVEARGLFGAPRIHLVIGDEAHATVLAALRFLGFGSDRVLRVEADGQGRMRPRCAGPDNLHGPVIVCAQAGNVNTGSFDPLHAIAAPCPSAARGSTSTAPSASGRGGADAAHLAEAPSWPTPGPPTATMAQRPLRLRHRPRPRPEAHRAAMTISAAYLSRPAARARPLRLVPEFSRRARGFRSTPPSAPSAAGIATSIDRCCARPAGSRTAPRRRGSRS